MNNNDGRWSLDCWYSQERCDGGYDPDAYSFSDDNETDYHIWIEAYRVLGQSQFKVIQIWEKMDELPPDGTWQLICQMTVPEEPIYWPERNAN